MYIQQYLALRNFCSRRQGEQWVRAGLIRINGIVAQCGQKVGPDDTIDCDPSCFHTMYRYVIYHKPVGIFTVNPLPGFLCIADCVDLSDDILPIGRLDKDTSGLIIMTNDRTLPKRLLDPDVHVPKSYSVRVAYPITDTQLAQLEHGIMIQGYRTKPARVRRQSIDSFVLTITEGKNRQVRKMVRRVGHRVITLQRICIGPIELGDLGVGEYRDLNDNEKFWDKEG